MTCLGDVCFFVVVFFFRFFLLFFLSHSQSRSFSWIFLQLVIFQSERNQRKPLEISQIDFKDGKRTIIKVTSLIELFPTFFRIISYPHDLLYNTLFIQTLSFLPFSTSSSHIRCSMNLEKFSCKSEYFEASIRISTVVSFLSKFLLHNIT